jgi:hypothetical protein
MNLGRILAVVVGIILFIIALFSYLLMSGLI